MRWSRGGSKVSHATAAAAQKLVPATAAAIPAQGESPHDLVSVPWRHRRAGGGIAVKLALCAAMALFTISSAANAAFNPVEFFRGRTHGAGTLKVIFQAPKVIPVESEGRTEKDGSLILRQVIHEPGKPERTRYWHLRQTGPNRFAGTLTDAASPVRVDVAGERVRIRYKGKDHLDFDQWLTPTGPTTVSNKMRVKRFGFTVARFEEEIRKLD
jgi:hypothetical protein